MYPAGAVQMLTLEVTAEGVVLCLEDGEDRYTLRSLPPGLDKRAWMITHAEDEGRSYRIAVDHDGDVRCACGAWRFRGHDCKHRQILMEVASWVKEVGL